MVPISHTPRPSLPREASQPAGLLLCPACDPPLSTEASHVVLLAVPDVPVPRTCLSFSSLSPCGEIPV